jgi:Flp pilus assembly pilin Flp
MNAITRFVREETGQSTVEYMLLISVIVIAIVAAAYVFVPTFQQGVQALANDIKSILDTGKIGSTGTTR